MSAQRYGEYTAKLNFFVEVPSAIYQINGTTGTTVGETKAMA
jgi:hypothetical protein